MAGNKSVRIILDTNIWISFLLSDRYRNLDLLFKQSRIKILFSVELLQEIRDTVQKPKLRKFFSPNAMEEMLYAFEDYMVWVEVSTEVTLCRDPKDDFLLSLAADGKADFLLTGDKDLLSLKKFRKTKIQLVSSFLSELKTL